MSQLGIEKSSFSWKQFWISMIYENLPPVFLSPIAALFIEGSVKKAWHVCQHRRLLVLSDKYNPLSSILVAWLLIYPVSWLMTAGIVGVFVIDFEKLDVIDPLQILCAYSFLLCRRLIIAVKYGYFTKAEYLALSDPAPEWNFDKTIKKLIALGWANPKKYPGLMDTEFKNALELSGESLGWHKDAKSSHLGLKSFVMGVLEDAYHLKKPIWHDIVLIVSVFGILIATVLTRYVFGMDLLGSDLIILLLDLGIYAGIMSAAGIMGFGFMCAFDFERRMHVAGQMEKAFIRAAALEKHDLKQNEIHLDIFVAEDMSAWMSARKVARAFGERYFLRVQAYTSILMCFSFLCVAALNLIAWTQLTHHVSTVVLLSTTVIVIAFIGSYAMFRGVQLQEKSYEMRAILQDTILRIEVMDGSSINGIVSENKVNSKNVLKQIDENLNFIEIIYRPIALLGYRADNRLIGSILGLLVTGALLALQGFVDTGISYDLYGWYL